MKKNEHIFDLSRAKAIRRHAVDLSVQWQHRVDVRKRQSVREIVAQFRNRYDRCCQVKLSLNEKDTKNEAVLNERNEIGHVRKVRGV